MVCAHLLRLWMHGIEFCKGAVRTVVSLVWVCDNILWYASCGKGFYKSVAAAVYLLRSCLADSVFILGTWYLYLRVLMLCTGEVCCKCTRQWYGQVWEEGSRTLFLKVQKMWSNLGDSPGMTGFCWQGKRYGQVLGGGKGGGGVPYKAQDSRTCTGWRRWLELVSQVYEGQALSTVQRTTRIPKQRCVAFGPPSLASRGPKHDEMASFSKQWAYLSRIAVVFVVDVLIIVVFVVGIWYPLPQDKS